MPAAFFKVRISLAAASAAGDAGFSGGGVCAGGGAAPCLGACAMAGAPDSARTATRPAADKIPEKRFIPILLDYRRHRRSTTRIPLAPARITVLARPTNSPLSTTPGIAFKRLARRGA